MRYIGWVLIASWVFLLTHDSTLRMEWILKRIGLRSGWIFNLILVFYFVVSVALACFGAGQLIVFVNKM